MAQMNIKNLNVDKVGMAGDIINAINLNFNLLINSFNYLSSEYLVLKSKYTALEKKFTEISDANMDEKKEELDGSFSISIFDTVLRN